MGHSEEERDARLAASWSTSDGRLHIETHNLSQMPLIGRRYRCVSLIGEGTFAQILRAEDTFDPQRCHVAIKVLNVKFGQLGRREAACLIDVYQQANAGSGSAGSLIKAQQESQERGFVGECHRQRSRQDAKRRRRYRLSVCDAHLAFGHFCIVMDLASCSLLAAAFMGTPLLPVASRYGREFLMVKHSTNVQISASSYSLNGSYPAIFIHHWRRFELWLLNLWWHCNV